MKKTKMLVGLLTLLNIPTITHAMNPIRVENSLPEVSLRELASLCRYKTEKPVPQQIKNRFIQKVLEIVPELKTRAMACYRNWEELPKNPPHSKQGTIKFKNYAFRPDEPELLDLDHPNHYRVFIGSFCPLDLLTEEDVVPCFATMVTLQAVLVRADLKEILLFSPDGYVSVEKWREYYNRELQENDEFLVRDWLQPFPEWFN